MTPSTDVALPPDGVPTTGFADLVPIALDADRRPEHPGRLDRMPVSAATVRVGAKASMVGDVRERHGGSELRAGGAGKQSDLGADDDEHGPGVTLERNAMTRRRDRPSRERERLQAACVTSTSEPPPGAEGVLSRLVVPPVAAVAASEEQVRRADAVFG